MMPTNTEAAQKYLPDKKCFGCRETIRNVDKSDEFLVDFNRFHFCKKCQRVFDGETTIITSEPIPQYRRNAPVILREHSGSHSMWVIRKGNYKRRHPIYPGSAKIGYNGEMKVPPVAFIECVYVDLINPRQIGSYLPMVPSVRLWPISIPTEPNYGVIERVRQK